MAVRLNLRAVCVDVIVRLLIARRELRVRPAIPEIVVFWSSTVQYYFLSLEQVKCHRVHVCSLHQGR